MGDLLDAYALAHPHGRPAWDEMFSSPGAPRPRTRTLCETLESLSAGELEARAAQRDRMFRDRGITFQLSGEERPFPLDLIPRLIHEDEWQKLERGVVQRVRALEALLADVYGAGRIFDDGVIPRSLVTSSEHFHRAAWGIEPANGVRVHVAGVDVVRGGDGHFYVLEDNLRCPSGVSYVIENRRMMARIFPELFASHRVAAVDSYPAKLLESLRASAPAGISDPTVVVMTPGVYNSAFFEHSFLARQMGVELVEGRDLACHSGRVYMRTSDGEREVHVIYRRVDDDFLDPLQFRSDSLVGCPGLLNVARAGNVTLANAVGNGVADDKLTYTYIPDVIRYYLSEEPLLRNVATYRLEVPDQLDLVLGRLDELVFKPVSGSGGYGIVIGPEASDEQLEVLRRDITTNPRAWIAQELVALSTAPTWVGDRIAARHLDLRPFAVNDGNDIWVLPGGLTRVALPEGGLVVNSSQGGGSKDTWVTVGAARRRMAASSKSTSQSAASRSNGGAWDDKPAAGTPVVIPDPGPNWEDPDRLRQQERQQQQQQQQRTPPLRDDSPGC